VVYNTPGTYDVTLLTSNSAGADTVFLKSHVTVSTSPYPAPATTGDSVCGPSGVVNLKATGSGTGTLRWWDAPGGGSIVNTGATYSPTLSSTTTFYVDEDFPPSAPDIVGLFDNTVGAGAMFSVNDIRGLYFDVLSPVLLKTVDVYSNSAGNRTIEVLDAFGTLMDTTVFIPASPSSLYTVTLNFKIYPGTQYFLKCRGLVDLYRNSAGATYPLTSSAINITGTNAGASGYYYFFYNWNYNPLVCNTARTPVTGIIGNCIGMEDLVTGGSLNLYPNPAHGEIELSFNVTREDDYTIRFTNPLGQVVYEEKLSGFTGSFSKKIDLASFGKGVYMMSLSNSGNEVLRKAVVY
jgi:PKD repeat protein